MFVLLHEDDIYGSLQGSLQHQGDELNEELDANFLLLSQYVGTLEEKFEISIQFLIKLITSILDGDPQISSSSLCALNTKPNIYIDFLTHGVSQLYFNINSVLLFGPLLVATMPYISYKLLKMFMPHCQKNKIFKDNIMIYVKQK